MRNPVKIKFSTFKMKFAVNNNYGTRCIKFKCPFGNTYIVKCHSNE